MRPAELAAAREFRARQQQQGGAYGQAQHNSAYGGGAPAAFDLDDASAPPNLGVIVPNFHVITNTEEPTKDDVNTAGANFHGEA